ncbi:acyl-CoA thioesterase [Halorutilales archaeon Cl-col2-1]|nr:thioesterase family protein [Halobacteria archaeon]
MEHTFSTRVRWRHTDASGQIHFASVFRYFEDAEMELLREAGWSLDRLHDEGYDIPRANAEANYNDALGYDDEIEVVARVEETGETSFTVGFEVYKNGDDDPAVEGEITPVVVEEGDWTPTEPPEGFFESID